MSQHDMDVANGAGVVVRADINNALQALASLSSGPSAPSPSFPCQLWADTGTSRLMRRNAANSAWVDEGPLDAALRDSASQGGFAADTGAANAYVCNFVPAITARSESTPLRFKAANANTGASTINDGVGTVALVGATHAALVGREIVANGIAWIQWNATVGAYVLLFCTGAAGPAVNQVQTAFTTAGTAPAFTLTPAPALGGYATNQRFRVKFNAAAATSGTLNVSGLGAKNLKQYDSSGAKISAVIASGQLTDVEYDGTDMVVLDPLPSQRQIQPITASVAANALTLTLNSTVLDFRSATLSSGAINQRSVTSAISLVVPSGATLGTANSVPSRIALIAIDNAGTVELACANLAGGNNLDETTLISTTAISAGATAANVIYSTTARTGVPFRVVGVIGSTQATAGTWATTPSLVQGQGGQAIFSLAGRTFTVVDSKPNGTAGGGITSGAFRTANLNTVEINEIPGASLAADQVTLPAGTYITDVVTSAFAIDHWRARLQNITAGTTIFESTNISATGTSTLSNTTMQMSGKFTILVSSVIELQKRSSVSRATDGLGVAASLGTSEIYSRVSFRGL